MQIELTHVKDCFVVTCDRHEDNRGFFQELFENNKYGMESDEFEPRVGYVSKSWKQVNWSHSYPNVLRGVHYAEYEKLVTCITGKIWDVVVDLRPSSPTYLAWVAQELSKDNMKQMFVPKGCGHGFYAFEESNVVYLQTGLFAVKGEHTIKYDDPTLGIHWPGQNQIISSRDANAGSFESFIQRGEIKND